MAFTAFSPICAQLLGALAKRVNTARGILDGASLSVSAQTAPLYIAASPADRDSCHAELMPLVERQLLRCDWHLQILAGSQALKSLQVPQGRPFVTYFALETQAETLKYALAQLAQLHSGVDWLDAKLSAMAERWYQGARFLHYGPEHIDQVVAAVHAARSWANEKIGGRSCTAVSLDWFASETALHRVAPLFLQLAESCLPSEIKSLPQAAQLAFLGLSDYPEWALAGPLSVLCDEAKCQDAGSWTGVSLPPESVRDLEHYWPISWVMTFSDKVQFTRYRLHRPPSAFLWYWGPVPSAHALALYRQLLLRLKPGVRTYFCGDTDFTGFKTALRIQQAHPGNRLTPWLMGASAQERVDSSGPTLTKTALKKLALKSTGLVRDTLIEWVSTPGELRPVLSRQLPCLLP
jgi:hypothetical protein